VFRSSTTLSTQTPVATGDDPPEADDGAAKTLRLPAISAADAVTERLVGAAPAAIRLAPPAPVAQPRARAPRPTPLTGTPRHPHRRRHLAIGITVAAIVVLITVIVVIWSLPHGSSAAPSVRSPYPTVSGSLGEHLAELQRSVAP
jgi:hypothetical protein